MKRLKHFRLKHGSTTPTPVPTEVLARQTKEITKLEIDIEDAKKINVDRLTETLLYTTLKTDPRFVDHDLVSKFYDSIQNDPATTSRVETRLLTSKHLKTTFKTALDEVNVILVAATGMSRVASRLKREIMDRKRNGGTAFTSAASAVQKQVPESGDSEGRVDIERRTVKAPVATLSLGIQTRTTKAPVATTSLDMQTSNGVPSNPRPNPEVVDQVSNMSRAKELLDISDSDGEDLANYSDLSLSEPEDVDNMIYKPKIKNRMGQRARRALWEEKFGRGAKHLHDPNAQAALLSLEIKSALTDNASNIKPLNRRERRGNVSRDERSGPKPQRPTNKRPSSTTDQQQPYKKARYESSSLTTSTTTTTAATTNKPFVHPERALAKRPSTGSEEVLHPSWEAARMNKDKKKGAIMPAMGKKIVFDD